MHHGIQLELPIDLGLAAQGEAAQVLVVAQVAEHRLDRGKAPSDHPFALIAVDALAHGGQHVGLVCRAFAQEERHLSCLGLVGGAQTPMPLLTGHAVLFGALELDALTALDRAVRAIAIQALARRAGADL